MKWTLDEGRSIEVERIKKLSIYKGKEHKLTSCGEKLYERYRIFGSIWGEEVEMEWYAINEKDLSAMIEVLNVFANVFSSIKLEIEITPESYPEMYRALKQYEEKDGDAWTETYGTPRILYKFLALVEGDTERLERNYRIRVDAEKIKKEANNIWNKITDDIERITRERLATDDIEITGIEYADYNEYQFEIRIGRLMVLKRFGFDIEKDNNRYILTISGEGYTLRIEDSSITIR